MTGLGFDHSFRVDVVGQSGGIWLLWWTDVGLVSIVESSEQFVHARVDDGVNLMHIIVVYAAPTLTRRCGLWDKRSEVIQGISEPFMVGGDFNTVLRLDERSGGNGRLSPDSLEFGSWINANSLIDMGFKGNKFTWRRGRVIHNYVAKCLDRVLCCAQTRLRWHKANVTYLPFLASDHAPIYVQLSPEVQCDPRQRPFRFEATWLSRREFKDMLASSWDTAITI
ncbi:PREDICTED: uncharacterized protein LOC109131561 [Camelina sativa]|uniref:Uncharacterized protein LOC109131561 n=1 Tax=Camelina sativa TaxID=90675 RepID=A0ABM1RGP7_CAMSA|nr:PREDICTED: uncharacterized protein LOC109131561 [Camelina sativa]